MKPKDLKPPFTWKERRVILNNGVLFVPEHYPDYQEFQFPSWSDPSLFGNSKPIKIEYCSGNGDWIAHRASLDCDSNWVAVEKLFDRTRKIWSKCRNFELSNLFIICGEALNATHHYLPTESVEEVYINFPDPWPKQRHAKNRLVRDEFIEQLHRILKPEGMVTLVTDDIDYREQMINYFLKNPVFRPVFPAPFFKTEFPNYGFSYFEELWRKQGKTIHYMQFIK